MALFPESVSVVGPENDDGVAGMGTGFKSVEDAPDVIVGPGDASQVGASNGVPGFVPSVAGVVLDIGHGPPGPGNVLVVVGFDAGSGYRFGIEVEELLRADEGEVRFDDSYGEEERLVVVARKDVHAIGRHLIVGVILQGVGGGAEGHLAGIALLVTGCGIIIQFHSIRLMVVGPLFGLRFRAMVDLPGSECGVAVFLEELR